MTESNDPRHDGHSFEAYARFCLDLAAKEPDRGHRLVLREMAAAWLNVTDDTAPGLTADRRDEGPETDGHAAL